MHELRRVRRVNCVGAPVPGYLLGNAGQWQASAAAHGVTVNQVPSVGAVAEWDGGAYGIGAEGHVAVVEAVGPDDKYILISQQHISSDVDGFDWTRINAGFPADSWQSWPSHFIHFAVKGYASVGYYSARTGSVAIRDSLTAGPASVKFRLSRPGMIPLAGDWTGRGTAGGYYNPANGTFHLRSGLDSGHYRPAFTFGPPGMIPLAGDWTGDGADRIGYYDPQDGSFHLHYYLSADGPSRSFAFGPPGMIPLAGDWTGKRADSVGYYDPRTGGSRSAPGRAAGRRPLVRLRAARHDPAGRQLDRRPEVRDRLLQPAHRVVLPARRAQPRAPALPLPVRSARHAAARR